MREPCFAFAFRPHTAARREGQRRAWDTLQWLHHTPAITAVQGSSDGGERTVIVGGKWEAKACSVDFRGVG
jgi:hypothetical protein